MLLAKKLAPGILLIGLLNCVHAQERSTFTLEECVQEALSNNPASLAAKHAEAASKEDVSAAEGSYYPEVGVQSQYRRWETHAFLPEGIFRPGLPTHIGPTNDWQLNVRANYTVFDSGLRSSGLQSAKSQFSAAYEESNRTRADLVYSVQSAYFEMLQAQDGLTLAKVRQNRSKDHLHIAEERKAAGAVPQADVTRARTQVSSADLDAAAAESALRIAQGHLNQVMGRAPNSALQIGPPGAPVPDPSGVRVDDVLQKALESRPEVVAAQKRADAKRNQIGAARSEILPKVRAEAGYGWRDDDFDPPDKDWWVGVTLNIPLFDGGVRGSHIAKSKIEADRELQQLAQARLSVQQEVWSAYSRWIEAFQSLQTSGVMKDEAAESLDLIKARYEEGAGTINDLLDAEAAFDQSETQFTNARYQLYIAYAAFQRAQGTL